MKRTPSIPDHDSSEVGQALAESVLVIILVLLLLGGLVEFGWAYFRYLAMQDAAGEGAAYAMMYATWHQGDTEFDPYFNDDPNNIVYRVQHESSSPILDWSATVVDIEMPVPSYNPGNLITVTVTSEHRLITPILSQLVSDGTITLRTKAVQTILAPPPEPHPTPTPIPYP